MEKNVSIELEQLKQTIEKNEQRAKQLDGVIVQLQEELKKKQAEVAKMEAEYPPDDNETVDSTATEKKPFVTKEERNEIKADFKKHLARIVDALDSIEFSRDWAVNVLDRYISSDSAPNTVRGDVSDFIRVLYNEADALQVEICYFMDMVRDVQTIVVDDITYPAKKYSEDR